MRFVNLRLATASLVAAAAIAGLACAPVTAAEPTAVQAPPPRPYVIPANVPAYVRAAVQSPDRTPAMIARDFDRKPAEVLALSGVKPGDRVLEFAAFGQYFTTLVSSVVGEKGVVYMLDLPYTEARAGAASREFVAKHPNARYTVADYNSAELPQNLDVVLNVLYYHDLPLNRIDTAALNARLLKSLKPGGIYFIVDHNAVPGTGMRDTEKLHRIDPAVIKQEVLASGFELVTESKLLANPADDHSWMVIAPGKRGTTDQSIFKFRKPLK